MPQPDRTTSAATTEGYSLVEAKALHEVGVRNRGWSNPAVLRHRERGGRSVAAPVTLCGTAFMLGVDGYRLRRHDWRP